MRYHNAESGIDFDLSGLNEERKRFFREASRKFRENISWFEFETFAFAFSSPVFRDARNRADVLRDPLYLSLKDMWLELGIKQGLVAARKESTVGSTAEKNRKTSSHRA